MKVKEVRVFNKPISLWFLSIFLFAIFFDGILSFPSLLKSSGSIPQYIVVFSHAVYVIASFIIIFCLWLSSRATAIIVIVWGLSSLGAALGGPLAFSDVRSTFPRTALIITVLIFLITYGLLIYTRYILRENKK